VGVELLRDFTTSRGALGSYNALRLTLVVSYENLPPNVFRWSGYQGDNLHVFQIVYDLF